MHFSFILYQTHIHWRANHAIKKRLRTPNEDGVRKSVKTTLKDYCTVCPNTIIATNYCCKTTYLRKFLKIRF